MTGDDVDQCGGSGPGIAVERRRVGGQLLPRFQRRAGVPERLFTLTLFQQGEAVTLIPAEPVSELGEGLDRGAGIAALGLLLRPLPERVGVRTGIREAREGKDEKTG
ncbi:MAG: hypothetical protein RRC34_05750 [Lentisphaeria bacterium]|nr:hypothetical protein [Lentisphaeria bacterium]